MSHFRRRLRIDIKKWGLKITSRQSQDISARRKSIQDLYKAHRITALKYIPEALIKEQPSSTSSGLPESLPLLLPSSLDRSAFAQGSMKALRETEALLRRTACLKALHTIRSLAISRAQLLRSKRQHKRSVANTTRSESYLQRLAERQRHAVWAYRNSRVCLMSISSDPMDARTFQSFKDDDLKQLQATVSHRSPLGEGYARLPWYWRIAPARTDDAGTTVEIPNSSVDQEYAESEYTYLTLTITCLTAIGIRVEWFRSRERALRWEEEVMWLEREAATVIVDFEYRACQWGSWTSHPHLNLPTAYAQRQQAVWHGLYKDATQRLRPLLEVILFR